MVIKANLNGADENWRAKFRLRFLRKFYADYICMNVYEIFFCVDPRIFTSVSH